MRNNARNRCFVVDDDDGGILAKKLPQNMSIT
jgi:hypothetical protein